MASRKLKRKGRKPLSELGKGDLRSLFKYLPDCCFRSPKITTDITNQTPYLHLVAGDQYPYFRAQ